MILKLSIFLSLLLYSLYGYAQEKSAIPTLDDDEGFAIIAIYSKGKAGQVILEGSGFGNVHSFGPLNYSQHFSVIKLKAGTYNWSKVSSKVDNSLKQYSKLEHLNLNFEVKAGKLNYTGLLMYETNNSSFSAKILNRTSILLAITKQDFPEYIEKFEVVNGLYPNDQYIDFFLNQSKPVLGED